VIDSIKTGSGFIFYEVENEQLLFVGDYSNILNCKNLTVAIIKTIEVEIMT
jgi:uncharacterized protein YhfF